MTYDTVNQRIAHLVKTTSKSMNQFAQMIGVSQPTISKIVNGKTEPQYSTLIAIIQTFGIDPAWLLVGEKTQSKNVYEPKTAYAKGNYAEALQEDWSYVRRIIQENHQILIFKVLGNSMAPTLWDQDLVFCYENGEEPIVNSYIYVIDSVYHGMLIKRVRQRDDGKIVVYGDNRDIAKSYPLNIKTEVKGLYRVRCKLTWQLGAPDNRLSAIEERLNKLGL